MGGYVFEEGEKPGKMDIKKAKEMGVPNGPLLGKLKNGEAVEISVNGETKTIQPTDFVGDPIPGRKICVLQDSSDSSYAINACKDVDLFIHECTFEKAMKEEAIDKGHSTTEMAAEWANECGAKKLAITHFSARYTESSKGEKKPDILQTDPEQMSRLQLNICRPCVEENEVDDEVITDPSLCILGAECLDIFKGKEVIVAQDFMVLEGPEFTPSKRLACKRTAFGGR